MPITVEIPGGTATLRDLKAGDQVTVAGRRAVQLVIGRLHRDTIRAIVLAGGLDDIKDPTDREAAQLAADEAMSLLGDDEYTRLLALPDATIFALLQSWTIDRPLPANPAALAAWPVDLYDPIHAEVQRRQADVVEDADQFTVAAVEDPDSPTGASAASSVPSPAAAEGTSEPKSLPGSPSTSTGPVSA